jgi:hypothetical protein
MNTRDPNFPYKNLFITARPGMGASTLAANIANKYLNEGKKCLIFDSETRAFLSHIDRSKVIRENTTIDKIRAFSLLEEYGNLTVTYAPIIDKEVLLGVIEEKDYDVIIYEDPFYGFSEFEYQTKELAELTKELRQRGKIFIFVTHLKRSKIPFVRIERNTLSVSRHRKAISCFDATAIVYRNCYYEDFKKADEDIEEIRIYERGKKKYRSVPVEFDFQHQRVKRK